MNNPDATRGGRFARQHHQQWIAFMEEHHPEIDPQAVRLMDEFVAVARMLYQTGETGVATTGLSFAQYRVLMHLFFTERDGTCDGLNPSTISDHQGTSRNTVSALIRSLEESGLVQRHLDHEDRRRFNIALTDTGRALVRDSLGQHMRTAAAIFDGLSPDDKHTLARILHQLSAQAQFVKS